MDIERLIIKNHEFFLTEYVEEYNISDFDDVILEHGPISSTVRFIKGRPVKQEVVVRHLRHSNAVTAKRIIDGFIKTGNEKIDLSKLKPSS